MSKRILILVPHDDDIVLSFGGLLAKAQRNQDIVKAHVFCMGGPNSNNQQVREKELLEVAKYYDLDITWDEGMDGLLSSIDNCSITRKIDNFIEEFKPDELYLGAESIHQDHSALYKAFLASCRLKSGFMPKLIAVGTYPFSDQLYPQPIGGKIFQPMSDDDFKRKCNAFAMHKSQLKPSPSPLGLEGLRVFSEYLGLMCGHKYAELYYQLRYIRSL